MSTLFSELDIDVVKLTLVPKAGGVTVDYYFAQDYWPAGTIYSGSPACYPLLVSPPTVKRANDVYFRIDQDVIVEIFADSHLSEYGKTFYDLLETHVLQNAEVEIRYYAKPVSEETTIGGSDADALASVPLWGGIYASLPSPGTSVDGGDMAHLAFTYRGPFDTGVVSASLTTHSEINIRQKLRAVNSKYDAQRGVIVIQCGDVLFKDKELSRRFDSNTFSGLDERWKGRFAPIVFGQSTIPGEGIAIDAPYFESGIDGSSRPTAKLFTGCTFPDHPNGGFERLVVRNQNSDQTDAEWVKVELESDAQTAGDGESVTTPVADPPNWPRDLTRYTRGISTAPSANAAKILTAARAYIKANNADRCADMVDGQYFFCRKNPDVLSRGDDDFTVELWVNFDLLHSGSASRIICQQGSRRKGGDLEWQIYFNTADDKIRFGISSGGSSISDSVAWGTAAVAGTWYHVICRHDENANQIKINVNAGTTVTASSTSAIVSGKEGYFTVGPRFSSDAGFDGKFYMFRYWGRSITDGDVLNLYNGGVPLRYDDLTDQLKTELSQEVAFNEPFGVRDGAHGSIELSPNNNTAGVSAEVAYAYCSVAAVTPSNKFGDLNVSVYDAKSIDSGNSFSLDKSPLRKGPVDITTSGFATGSANVFFQIDPPLVMADPKTYMAVLDMENADTNTYFCLCSYDDNPGSTHYAIDKRKKAERDQPQPNWAKQNNVRLDLQLYYLGEGDDGWVDSTATGDERYSYLHLEAKSIDLADGQTQLEFVEKLDFKACVTGLLDDTLGTYTGTPNSVIERPTHIIRFILLNPDFGLGLDTSDLDESSFANAATALETLYPDGLKMQIVIETQTSARDLITEICRQARLVFYKTNDGKLALKVPVPHSGFDARFTEARHRADFDLQAVADRDYSKVVNEYDQLYYRDPINLPPGTNFRNLNPKDRLTNELFITPDESTQSDDHYEALCAASQALYGRKVHTQPFSFFDSPLWAQPVQNYYCARFTTLQKRATFRIPRRTYFGSLNLFSAVQIQHTGLANEAGTSLKAKGHDNGTPVRAYIEGTPVHLWKGGILDGQVMEIEEAGPWMTLVAETISPHK